MRKNGKAAMTAATPQPVGRRYGLYGERANTDRFELQPASHMHIWLERAHHSIFILRFGKHLPHCSSATSELTWLLTVHMYSVLQNLRVTRGQRLSQQRLPQAPVAVGQIPAMRGRGRHRSRVARCFSRSSGGIGCFYMHKSARLTSGETGCQTR